MNLKLEIPPRTFEQLQFQADQAGMTLEAYTLSALNDRLESAQREPAKKHSAEQLQAWLKDWSSKFPTLDHQVDDSRESFYAGRE
jgi:hypothetical protein